MISEAAVEKFYQSFNSYLENDDCDFKESLIEMINFRTSFSDILALSLMETASYHADWYDAQISEVVKSPIEKAIIYALIMISRYDMMDIILINRKDLNLKIGDNLPQYANGIVVYPQFPIGKYFADFIVSYFEKDKDGKVLYSEKLIVECDGHEFHEKTKEQIRKDKARDRFIQIKYKVFRYSGSEIYADSFKCASEIIKFLRDEVNKKKEAKNEK